MPRLRAARRHLGRVPRRHQDQAVASPARGDGAEGAPGARHLRRGAARAGGERVHRPVRRRQDADPRGDREPREHPRAVHPDVHQEGPQTGAAATAVTRGGRRSAGLRGADYPPLWTLHTPLSHSSPVAQAGLQVAVPGVPPGSSSLCALQTPSSHSWPEAQTGLQDLAPLFSECVLQTPSSHSWVLEQAGVQAAPCSSSTSISPSWLMLVLYSPWLRSSTSTSTRASVLSCIF